MSTSTALQSLLAFSAHTCCRATLFSLRVRQGFLALLFALVPVVASAQVGREFVAVEAYVGRARVVHVGKILQITQIEYGKPLTDIQKLGKPYRLVFAVSETIRGEEVKGLELVLSLQSTRTQSCTGILYGVTAVWSLLFGGLLPFWGGNRKTQSAGQTKIGSLEKLGTIPSI